MKDLWRLKKMWQETKENKKKLQKQMKKSYLPFAPLPNILSHQKEKNEEEEETVHSKIIRMLEKVDKDRQFVVSAVDFEDFYDKVA